MSESFEARLEFLEEEMLALRQALGNVATLTDFTQVGVHKFEGGSLPVRQTDGAIGFDAFARAIVDPRSKATIDNPLRRTMADFNRTSGWSDRLDPDLKDWAVDDPNSRPDRYAIELPPGERLMVGLGFATDMKYPMYYWVAPRSGFASRGITVANSPGTVDPDYRGEAGALVENNSKEAFVISHNMRVVQVIFGLALIPKIIEVSDHSELGDTKRGAGGFGSTGAHGNSN